MSKSFVVAGGGSGIGAALCGILESEGHQVVTFHRSGQPGVDTTDASAAFPDPDGPVDGLAYLPGTITLKPFASLDPDEFRRDWEVNLLGAVLTLRHYLPRLQEAERASVVFFSTVAVGTGMPFHASIAAAKGAVEGLTRSLAAELAPEIRVNAIAPSITDTPLASRLLRSDKQREAAEQRHPLRSVGDPEDVARLARHLLTGEGSSWMTGQVLAVDGGLGKLRLL